MHNQNISNEQRNVDWNKASIIPGIQLLNSTDSVKNGSNSGERQTFASVWSMGNEQID